MKWLDQIPLPSLAVIAALLALLPFTPEPHLWQKLKMLADGALVRPLDILDLAVHGGPLLLLAARIARRHATTQP